MAARLAKMECIVKEASRCKGLTPPSEGFLEFDSMPDPKTTLNARRASPDPSELVFEEDELTLKRTFPGNSLSDQGGIGPYVPSSTGSSVDGDPNVEYSSSFSIFSPPCIQWINELVGDDSFARELYALKSPSPSANNGTVGLSSIHSLPSKTTTIECAKEYLAGLNRVAHLFDDQEILNGIERYYSTGKIPTRSWFNAINVIVAHALREKSGRENSVECEKYIGNAMNMVPSALMSEPDSLNTGAMLSLTLYFNFLRKSQTSIMILGAAIQLMILGGYHTTRKRPGQTDLDKFHERRLFWQAFVLDHDLALHVGKPPIIGLELVTDLPHSLPDDGVGTVTFADGTTLDILREQVALAKIKSKVYSRLYAKDPSTRCAQEDAKAIFDLDSELYAWKRNIPDINRVSGAEKHNKDPGLIALTILHYTYYQVLIVLHSFVFQFPVWLESHESFGEILSSVALCVGAARATISLLDFHEDCHPFSMHLLNDVSWSLDIVFIHTLQNKGDVSAQEDLALLGKVLSIFKKYDSNYMNAMSFRIAHIFHRVAWNALQNYAFSITPPLNKIFPPTDVPLSKAWSISVGSRAAPGGATALQSLESRQIPFCEQTTAPWSSNPLHHIDTDTTGPGISDQFPSSRLDDNSTSVNGNMDWTDHNQGVMNNELRLSFGSHPQHWEEWWNTVAVAREEEI
ncbi:hypothetical protein DL98DRAFT_505623 [Cadophora sp. DSE1049]|nr:hypothetical protein DL98DRAFT_505623 [Cadophora sp. DSE1049]